MDAFLTSLANRVRHIMHWPAVALDRLSGGRAHPNHVTLISLLGHLLVVYALWQDQPVRAAVYLAIFGVMDALDGALAKVQKRASVVGMLYDATSDRVKEVLLYIGLLGFVSHSFSFSSVLSQNLHAWYIRNLYVEPLWIVVAVAGFSLVVSYIKAKGEMALSTQKDADAQKLNRVFSDGFARYEVRMALVIIGLATGTIFVVLHLLLAMLALTCLQRIFRISRALSNV